MGTIDNLTAMLAQGRDSPLLRYGLGNASLKAGDIPAAIVHLAAAVALDPAYSAAWKGYGKALAAAGRDADARAAYDRGIAAAEARGDLQAAKEMRVFRSRLTPAAAAE